MEINYNAGNIKNHLWSRAGTVWTWDMTARMLWFCKLLLHERGTYIVQAISFRFSLYFNLWTLNDDDDENDDHIMMSMTADDDDNDGRKTSSAPTAVAMAMAKL